MGLKSRITAGLAGGCAIAAVMAAPVSAAPAPGPATATTDAGTTCTVDADAKLAAGLLVKPIDFTGSISCQSADPSNPATSSGSLALQNGLPLGLSSQSAKPNDPVANKAVPNEEGIAYTCEVGPGADCGFTGRETLGVPGQTYTAVFGTGITAPAGERFVSVTDGCSIESDVALCASTATVTVR